MAEELAVLFNTYDVTGDGTIDYDEFREVFEILRSKNVIKGSIETALKQLDSDQSGEIDLFEFATWFFRCKSAKSLKLADLEITTRARSLAEKKEIEQKQKEVDEKIEQAKIAGLTGQIAELEAERNRLCDLADEKEKQLEKDLAEIADLKAQLQGLNALMDLSQSHADHQLYEMKTFLGLKVGEPAAGGGMIISQLPSNPLDSASMQLNPAVIAGIAESEVLLSIDSMPINSAADFMRSQDILAVGDVVSVKLRGVGGLRTVEVSVRGEGVPIEIQEDIVTVANLRIRERVGVKQGDGVYHKVLGQAILQAVKPNPP
jgi:hypothetical protein